MNEEVKNELIKRNNRIIEIVRNKIEADCPGAVDLIGIAGSFCGGDIHEKSDLDLVIIINDDRAKCLDVCFILGDVGFDIYTCKWNRLEAMSEYDNPYVTKLFDLDIVYAKDESIINKYNSLQKKLLENMSDETSVSVKVGKYFSEVLSDYETLVNSNETNLTYVKFAHIVQKLEYILYMLNRRYVKLGVRRIQEEIKGFGDLPSEFLDEYLGCADFSNSDELKKKCSNLISIMKNYLESKGIKIINVKSTERLNTSKREIQSDDLTGTYEEIFSNWYNKMVLASNTGNQYLSFMTMASCQELYDEMFEEFDIQYINLIDKYKSIDLNGNVRAFVNALNEWKELYERFGKKVLKFELLDELEEFYRQNKRVKF